MPYSFTTSNATDVTATELVTSIYDMVDSAFYDVKYPDLLWNTVLDPKSIKSDMAPGAMNYVYRSRDVMGMGQFVSGDPNNIPRVGQKIKQTMVPVLDAAVGSTVTDAEARRYAYGMGASLANDLGEIMRKACDRHIERVFFFGDDMAGFNSYLDYPTVPKIPTATWDGAESSVWVAALNDAMTSMYVGTKNIHLADTIEMPPSLLSMMTAAHVIGAGTAGVAVSAINYFRQNNIYTLTTGKELTIRPLRYLEGAGVGGADRIILKDSRPEHYIMPFPMPYQLAQPVPAALSVHLFAQYVFGSFHVRYPLAMSYLDVAQPSES